MKYLRSNLVYCFQNSTRLDVLDAIESFEQRFFTYQQRRESKQDEKKEVSEQRAEDNIESAEMMVD